MKLEQVDSVVERIAIDEQRLAAWGSFLGPAGFHGRQRRLYEHPYGRARAEHYALRDGNGVAVSSFEVLMLTLEVKDARGKLDLRPAGLIASVVTPVEFRGKGYATRMLTEYFEKKPSWNGILFSDIGAPFYERFDFTAYPVGNIERPVARVGDAPDSAEPISFDSFIEALGKIRRKVIEGSEVPTAVVSPDPEFLDWQLERFRYFADLTGKKMPETLFWKVTHATKVHLLCAVPDFVRSCLNAMWIATGCPACVQWLDKIARDMGMKSTKYWERRGAPEGTKLEYPMIRTPENEIAFSDIQFCDWF